MEWPEARFECERGLKRHCLSHWSPIRNIRRSDRKKTTIVRGRRTTLRHGHDTARDTAWRYSNGLLPPFAKVRACCMFASVVHCKVLLFIHFHCQPPFTRNTWSRQCGWLSRAHLVQFIQFIPIILDSPRFFVFAFCWAKIAAAINVFMKGWPFYNWSINSEPVVWHLRPVIVLLTQHINTSAINITTGLHSNFIQNKFSSCVDHNIPLFARIALW